MKRLIFILSLFASSFTYAQTVGHWMLPGKISIVTPAITHQTIKINLTDATHSTALPDWNNYAALMTPVFLTDSTGVTTGVKMTAAIGPFGSINVEGPFGTHPGSTYFPADITLMAWTDGSGNTYTLTFTGFDDAKTYMVRTGSFYDGGVGTTTISVNGGTSQSMNPTSSLKELIFPGIVSSGGVITVTFSGTSGADCVLNGLIISY